MKPVILTVLTSPGCVHCHAFLEFWKTIASDWTNVTLKEISAITPEGQSLVGKYMIFATPGILLNDELLFTGGYNKEEFLKKLAELSK